MVKWKLLTVFAVAAGYVIPSGSVFAHHSNSIYDRDHQTELKGEVTDFEWINPHIHLFFEVTDDHGNVKRWMSEGPSPSQMAENGWKKETLKPGDHVSIVGNPARNGSPSLRLRWVTLPNGKDLYAYRN
jgi:uncharacterized protein DUF6152